MNCVDEQAICPMPADAATGWGKRGYATSTGKRIAATVVIAWMRDWAWSGAWRKGGDDGSVARTYDIIPLAAWKK